MVSLTPDMCVATLQACTDMQHLQRAMVLYCGPCLQPKECVHVTHKCSCSCIMKSIMSQSEYVNNVCYIEDPMSPIPTIQKQHEKALLQPCSSAGHF